jgi:hypothetical protein
VVKKLPVIPPVKKPSIDAARTRLGGAAQGHTMPPGLAAGVPVRFANGSGVVIFASIVEVHVMLDGSRMRRFAPADLVADEGVATGPLAQLAADARIFGSLHAAQAVRYAADDGELVRGVVVEKCRWGALVERADGAVVAVGFRKLWPVPTGEAV